MKMSKSESGSYKKAGVDITAGYRAVELMKKHVSRTVTPGVLQGLGGFGGLFEPPLEGMKKPVLVSGTDGVGTKLKIAFELDKHDTIGIDCVAMCVNDIICCGAKPLFFLDYLAQGKTEPEKVEQIVAGISEGCVQAGCALVGGETAEMPGLYAGGEYDLAGFAVGIVDKEKIITNENMAAGDVIIALPSSGVHSNGFSLVRHVFGEKGVGLSSYVGELGCALGETLLTPTKIYVKPVLEMLREVDASGISHITGGGFYENIPRALKPGLTAKIEKAAVKTPAIFRLIAETGDIPERDMWNTFNMGVGMTVITPRNEADKALDILRANGEDAYAIGEIASGADGVLLW